MVYKNIMHQKLKTSRKSWQNIAFLILALITAYPSSLHQKHISLVPGTSTPAILSAKVATPPMNPIPSSGDLWMNTWADDGHLYTGWGDGEGPGDVPPVTDCGVGVLKGTVPYFLIESNPSNYVRNRLVPDGSTKKNDKPSSLLFYKGHLYFAGHTPLGDPDFGYIAYSDDHGKTWHEISGSPWTKAAKSSFRCLFFINIGKSYQLKKDSYAYAYGIGKEWAWFPSWVYLARVPFDSILNYKSYEYYAGMSGNTPLWSERQTDAVPVANLKTHQMPSAMYHEGIERYLFLTISGLFEAPNPWGPWIKVASLLNGGDDAEWKEGYMPGIITKGAGADFFYFTLAGQSDIIRYYLHVGKIAFKLSSEIQAQATANITRGKPPLRVQFKGSGAAPGAKIKSYRWYFGDGAVSTAQNPTHQYNSPAYGKYRAMLTVTDELGRRGFDIVEITVPFCNLSLRPAEQPGPCSLGLTVKYYNLPSEGGETVPDFSKMIEYKADFVSQINYPSKGKAREGGTVFATSGCKDCVAALFTGYLEAPADGVYTFYLLSDDASEFHIGSEKVIDNNGEHKCQMRERAGQIALKAGKHSFWVGYTEINLLNGLRLYWEGPGFERELVPSNALWNN
jgi:hypothetical protein